MCGTMTLEQLNIALQIVGSIGVIGSLIFVGLQVRQNTKTTRVQVQENMTSCYISVAQLLIDNAEVFTRGIAATRESFALFSDADKMIYFGGILAMFKHFENIHSQRQRGFIDQESWAAWSEHILMYFNQPGVKMWWELRRGSFNPRFRTFLESSPPPEVPTFVELMHG
jgi:hypothetical protein